MAFKAVIFLLAASLLVSTKGTETFPGADPKSGIPAKTTTPAPITPSGMPRPPVSSSLKECAPQCADRCSAHSRPKICIRACSTCCYRCKCVPPGTSGNRGVCGVCWAKMKTKGGREKCP